MIFLICCWILFARILLRIFASMFIIAIDLWFCLFVASLSGLVIRVMVASKSEFVSLPSSATYWKSLRRIGVRSSLKFLVGFTCEAIWSCFFFFFFSLGRFLSAVWISMIVTCLFGFSISSWFRFGGLCFPKHLSISSKLSFFLAHSC